MMFYMVTYKPIGKSTKKTLVKARNEEEAKLMFNNPDEIGKTAEIKEVKIAKRIPKGWHVTFEKTDGFPITGKTTEDIYFEETSEFTFARLKI